MEAPVIAPPAAPILNKAKRGVSVTKRSTLTFSGLPEALGPLGFLSCLEGFAINQESLVLSFLADDKGSVKAWTKLKKSFVQQYSSPSRPALSKT